jgi:hypothetical protein
MVIDWQGWLHTVKLIAMFIAGVIGLYIIIRLSASAFFRSYFEAKSKNHYKRRNKV